MSANTKRDQGLQFMGCQVCGSVERVQTVRRGRKYSFQSCTECDFWFVPESIVADYSGDDAVSQMYDNYSHNRQFRFGSEKETDLYVESLRQRLALCTGSWSASDHPAFLDVGCGSGGYVYAANHLGLEGFGIEVDTLAAELGRTKGLNIVDGTFEAVDLPRSHFMFIQFKQTLEHIPNVTQTLGLARELLRPGGYLLVDVPNMYGFVPRIKMWFPGRRDSFGALQPPRHAIAFTKKSLRLAVENAGFEVTYLKTAVPGDIKWYPLPRQPLHHKIMFKITDLLQAGSLIVLVAKR